MMKPIERHHDGTLRGSDLPLIDLGPYLSGGDGALDATAERLRRASEEVGFYMIVNHGIPAATIADIFALAAEYHAADDDVKSLVPISQHMHGFMPLGGSTTRTFEDRDNLPSRNESFFLRGEIVRGDDDFPVDRSSPIWPARPADFGSRVRRYFTSIEGLALAMLPLYARALGVDHDHFAEAFVRPMSFMRLSHYPPGSYRAHEFGIAPHTDSTFITILAQNEVAGLQVRLDGRWHDVPSIEGTMVVNSGDVLRHWTGGRFLSTPHRAFNLSDRPRYAIPYFIHPNRHARMRPLSPDGRDDVPAYETIEEYVEWFSGMNYQHRQTSS